MAGLALTFTIGAALAAVSGATVFSTTDVASKIRSCSAMSCADGDIGEGMTVDLDAGLRLNYWFVANDQRVQLEFDAALLKEMKQPR